MENKKLVIPVKIKVKLYDYEKMYIHYFIPFSGERILNSDYFSEYKQEFSDIILKQKEVNIDIPGITESVNSEYIIEDLPFIILDSLFSLHLCFGNPSLANYLTESKIQSIIRNESDIIKYVGIYTEFLKVRYLNLMYDISILMNLYSNQDVDNEKASKLIALILQKYNNPPVINSINRHTITAGINCILQNLSNNASYNEFDIDLFAFEQFIKLLDTYKYYKYLFNKKCFCLAKENNDYFFSLSGTSKEPPKSFYNTISDDLKKIVKTVCKQEYDFIPSMLTDKTLSYGNFLNNQFTRFANNKPISYKDSDKTQPDIERQYSCCERKILAALKNGNGNLSFYCKYSPCAACQPALNENTDNYHITFQAFISTPEAFMRKIEQYKTKILSIKNYNLITYM